MDQNNFGQLYFLMRELEGLVDHRHVGVEDQILMFLSILTHHNKKVLILNTLFLVDPSPVPDDSTNPRWKWFKLSKGIGFVTICPSGIRLVKNSYLNLEGKEFESGNGKNLWPGTLSISELFQQQP
ncbi:hypothetical protein ACS0TY_021867 [Phlomoides rotata]